MSGFFMPLMILSMPNRIRICGNSPRQDVSFAFENAIMVGDRLWADMLGAKMLGMTTVKINQGEHRFETPERGL